MSRFGDMIDKARGFLDAELARLENLLAPLAEEALKQGATTIASDAMAVAAAVAADPSILTSAAQREAVVKALGEKLVAQGVALGDHELHAFAAAALAQTKLAPASSVMTGEQPQNETAAGAG